MDVFCTAAMNMHREPLFIQFVDWFNGKQQCVFSMIQSFSSLCIPLYNTEYFTAGEGITTGLIGCGVQKLVF